MSYQNKAKSLFLVIEVIRVILASASPSSFNNNFCFSQHITYDPQKDDVSSDTETLVTYFEQADQQNEQSFIMTEFRFDDSEDEYDDDDISDDDDDDDDDDGGDSSMLSGTFIHRRSKVILTAAASSSNTLLRDDKYSKQKSYNTYVKPNSRRGSTSVELPSQRIKLSMNQIRGGTKAATTISAKKTKLHANTSEYIKQLVAAALTTLLFEASLGHLLEFLKILAQTSPPNNSYLDHIQSITSQKGIMGIWDGFIPWGVIQSILKGASFGCANSIARSVLMPYVHQGKLSKNVAHTLSGGFAGIAQGYCLSPMLLLKTRVMTNDVFRKSMTFFKTTMLSLTVGIQVVQAEGLLALFKGANIFAFKRMFDWSTRFYFSSLSQSLLLHFLQLSQLSNGQKAIADFLGGTASTISTLPLDVLVANIQDANKAGIQISPIAMINKEIQENGPMGFLQSYTKGFIARLLHVCFATVTMKTGTDIMYQKLFS